MAPTQWEHLSIILEVMAFFLVTTDLYGKERLARLREKIGTIRTREIEARLKRGIQDTGYHLRWLFFVPAVMVYLVTVGLYFLGAYKLCMLLNENFLVLGLIGSVVVFLLLNRYIIKSVNFVYDVVYSRFFAFCLFLPLFGFFQLLRLITKLFLSAYPKFVCKELEIFSNFKTTSDEKITIYRNPDCNRN